MVLPLFTIVLGLLVVVFFLVDMPQSSPCAGTVVLFLFRFPKINQTIEFFPKREVVDDKSILFKWESRRDSLKKVLDSKIYWRDNLISRA